MVAVFDPFVEGIVTRQMPLDKIKELGGYENNEGWDGLDKAYHCLSRNKRNGGNNGGRFATYPLLSNRSGYCVLQSA